MTLRQDIDAKLATGDYDGAQRLILDAYLPILVAREGQTYTSGNLSVTLVRAWEWSEGGKSWLALHLAVQRNGVRVAFNNPLLLRLPPVGTVGDTADLIAWAQTIILDNIPPG